MVLGKIEKRCMSVRVCQLTYTPSTPYTQGMEQPLQLRIAQLIMLPAGLFRGPVPYDLKRCSLSVLSRVIFKLDYRQGGTREVELSPTKTVLDSPWIRVFQYPDNTLSFPIIPPAGTAWGGRLDFYPSVLSGTVGCWSRFTRFADEKG